MPDADEPPLPTLEEDQPLTHKNVLIMPPPFTLDGRKDAPPGRALPLSELEALVDQWFSTTFPGTPVAAEHWNHLQSAVGNLKTLLATASQS